MKNKDTHLFKPLSYLENLGQENETDSYVSFMCDEIEAYPSIRNIGVIGPYGSGKSSVVHSFLNNKSKDYKHTLFFSQETIAEHLISNSTNGKTNSTPENFHTKVKKAIYLELLKYDTSSILLKEYNERLLNRKKWRLIVACVAFGFAAISLSFALFVFLNCIKDWNFLISFFLSFALLNIFAAVFFAFYIKSVSLSFHSKKVDGSAELLPIRNYNEISEQINNHPTELDNLILFIIERNKIKYFVIEDMERLRKDAEGCTFNNIGGTGDDVVLEIIKQFKILSDLINRSKVVKRTVRFIYGLNDECFKDSEIRSKFFDLIVPVVPLATYSSAAQAIAEEPFIKELIDNKELSKSTINSISLHFKNQRQINALLAQFYLNCQKLPHLKMFDKVFAITSLMVLFPHFSHSLYSKNNSLDLLLSEEWSLIDNVPSLKSGRAFPKDLLDDKEKNLLVFLKMCINRELITKSYRLLLTTHKVADNSILSEKDVELLIAFFSDVDISDERFENPENVLERIDDSDFINNPYSFYPQLLDCMVGQDDKNKLKLFKESIDLMQDQQDKAELIAYLVNECKELTVNFIAESFITSPFVYNMVPNLKEGRNYVFAFMLLAKTKLDFLKNNKNSLKDYLSFISGSAFLDNQKKHLHPSFIEKLINSDGFMPKDISAFKDNSGVLALFKKHPCFEINTNNLYILYPSFKTQPFIVLNENKDVCNAFLSSANAHEVLEQCEFDNDIKHFAFFFLNKAPDNNVCNLLDSKYFNPWRFKLAIGSEGGIELSLGQSRINALLNHDLLDLSVAYSKWYKANDGGIFLDYIKESVSKINEYKPRFESELSSFLFSNLTKDELMNYAGLLNYSFLNKDISAINAEKLFAVLDYIDEDSVEQLLEKTSNTNDSLFNSICERKAIIVKDANKIKLTKSEMANIFEKNLESYFPLLLSMTNFDIFKQYISEAGEGMDFAKLIFLKDGTLRTGVNSDSVALVCRYEVENDGALEKVFNQIDDDSLKSGGWIGFIDTYVCRCGSADKYNKLSLPSNKLTTLIYDRFISIKRIFAAKGQGKNRLYFTLSHENILF